MAALESGKVRDPDDDYWMITICDKYSWTQDQYRSNESWFLKCLRTKISLDGQKAAADAEQNANAQTDNNSKGNLNGR